MCNVIHNKQLHYKYCEFYKYPFHKMGISKSFPDNISLLNYFQNKITAPI